MSSSSLVAMRDDSPMSSAGPRAGGPTSRRSFTLPQKLDHPVAYEAAIQRSRGGAYLRSEGLYSSQIAGWRKLRDAGVLAGKEPRGEDWPAHGRAGRDRPVTSPSGDHGAASGHNGGGVENHGKSTRAIGANIGELAGRDTAHETLMATCHELRAAGESTRVRRHPGWCVAGESDPQTPNPDDQDGTGFGAGQQAQLPRTSQDFAGGELEPVCGFGADPNLRPPQTCG